ncbi:hypothetical protein [Lysobacter fragariae]
MKRRNLMLNGCLLVACLFAALPAGAGGPATTGALATPANRIVGTWANEARIGPCGGAAGAPGSQTLLFNAGGTFLDNPRFPPAGIPVPGTTQRRYRSVGVGTWSLNPDNGQYSVDQRFDWYLDSQYDGYQTVHRTILLSTDGNQAGGPVITRRYAADGSLMSEMCGSALSTRI